MLSPSMRLLARILVLATVWGGGLGLVWTTEPPTSISESTPAQKASLERGSWVSIRIVEDKRDALLQSVAVTGEICAPYIGVFKAAGLTADELAAKLKTELEKEFFTTATVVVQVIPPPPDEGCAIELYMMFGHVAHQGRYDFPHGQDLTISEALARAGGYNGLKSVPAIKVCRKTPGGTKYILVDAHAVLVEKSTEHDLFLRLDDAIIVE